MSVAIDEIGLAFKTNNYSGTIASVGYVGWSTLGGYGPLTSHYGLGVDQILGAKIVNASGEVQTANEEILVGIRGGGGSLGIITELTIKVYPVPKVSFEPATVAFADQARSSLQRSSMNQMIWKTP